MGVGSTFSFTINVPVVIPTDRLVPSAQQQTAIWGYHGRRRRVLVVDDRQENRLVLLNLLEPLGFEVLLAEHGQEALEQMQMFQPDVLLLDLVMPVLDGFMVIQHVRATPALADTRIIAVSASAFRRDRQEGGNLIAGTDGFLLKPVDADLLFALLQEQLGLEWVYTEQPAAPTTPASVALPAVVEDVAEGMVLPPQQELQKLYEHALFGSMDRVLAYVDALEAQDAQYAPFVGIIRAYAQDFLMMNGYGPCWNRYSHRMRHIRVKRDKRRDKEAKRCGEESREKTHGMGELFVVFVVLA